GLERGANWLDVADHFLEGQTPFLIQNLLQISTDEQLHDAIGAAVRHFAKLIDVNNIGAVYQVDYLGFTNETLDHLIRRRHLAAEDFEGGGSSDQSMVGPIYNCEPTPSKDALGDVFSNFRARRERLICQRLALRHRRIQP